MVKTARKHFCYTHTHALKQNVHSSTDQSVIKGSLKNMHNVSQWFVLLKKIVWIRETKITGVMITHEDTEIVFPCTPMLFL